MRKLITIQEPKEVMLIKEYVLRGIRTNGVKKECIAEKKFDDMPMPIEIAMFLQETGADFCSLVENYRIEKVLPFE